MLLHLHSGLPYLIILSGIAVILYALRGVITKKPHDKTMKHLAVTFRTLMDVTLFSGLVMVMTGFGFYNDLGVHVIMMLLATVVSHVVPSVMRKRPQEERTLMPYVVATTIALGMLALGVMSIAKGA